MSNILENLGKKIAAMNIVSNTFIGILPITFIPLFYSTGAIPFSFSSLIVILFLSYFNGLIIFHLSKSIFSLLNLDFSGDYIKEIYKEEPNNYLIALMQKAIIYRGALTTTVLNFLLFIILVFFVNDIALLQRVVPMDIYMIVGITLIIFLLVTVIFMKAYLTLKNKIDEIVNPMTNASSTNNVD